MTKRLCGDWGRIRVGSSVSRVSLIILLVVVVLTCINVQVDGRHVDLFLSLSLTEDGDREDGTDGSCHLKGRVQVGLKDYRLTLVCGVDVDGDLGGFTRASSRE